VIGVPSDMKAFDLFCELVTALRSKSVRVRREAIAAIGKVADQSCLNVLLDSIRIERDVEVKASLLKILGSVGTASLIPMLQSYLADPDGRCRSNTIEALGMYSNHAATVVPLIQKMVHDTDNRVAGTAVKILYDLGDVSALKYLASMLRGDDNARRCSAIWAVGEMRHLAELPILVEYLGSTRYRVHSVAAQAVRKFGSVATPELLAAIPLADPFRRAYLARALGETGDPTAVEPVRQLMREGSEVVQVQALEALSKLTRGEPTPDVLAALGSGSADVRAEALKAIRTLDAADTRAKVVALIGHERDARVLSAAAAALGRSGDSGVVNTLRTLLSHADARVKANAVEALGKIGDARIVQELRPFLQDPDGRVLANAAIALYEFGDLDVVELLKERLRTGNERVRMSVAYALGEIPLEQVVEPLVQAVLDRSALVRRRVLSSLVKKQGAARAQLERMVSADQRLLEQSGVPQAVGQLGVKVALGPLLNRFLGANPPVGSEGPDRVATLFTRLRQEIRDNQLDLSRSLDGRDPDVVHTLRELLSDEDPQLRCFAAHNLGELKCKDVMGTLLCLLHDPDDSVRSCVVNALGKIQDQRALPFLTGLLEDENADLRANAARVVSELSAS
jgi:HEAT repeat protein